MTDNYKWFFLSEQFLGLKGFKHVHSPWSRVHSTYLASCCEWVGERRFQHLTWVYLSEIKPRARLCVCVFVCECICVCVCTCMCVSIYIYLYVYVYVRVYIYICMCMWMCVCVFQKRKVTRDRWKVCQSFYGKWRSAPSSIIYFPKRQVRSEKQVISKEPWPAVKGHCTHLADLKVAFKPRDLDPQGILHLRGKHVHRSPRGKARHQSIPHVRCQKANSTQAHGDLVEKYFQVKGHVDANTQHQFVRYARRFFRSFLCIFHRSFLFVSTFLNIIYVCQDLFILSLHR